MRRMPGKLILDSWEITDVLSELVASIIQAIKKTLEATPVELINDIIANGIIMTGGGALLKDLHRAITKETKIAVSLAENPLDSVAIGTGKMLSSLEMLKTCIIIQDGILFLRKNPFCPLCSCTSCISG